MIVTDEKLQAKWLRIRDPDHIEHEDIILFLEFNPDARIIPYLCEAIELRLHLNDDHCAEYPTLS